MLTRRSPLLVCASFLGCALVTGCSGGGGGGATGDGDTGRAPARFSVAGALAELPSPKGSSVTVSMADVRAVADADGLEPPGSTAGAAPAWLMTVTGVGDSVVMLSPPAGAAETDPSDYAAATGSSWVEADWFASVSAPPQEFSVLAGPPASAPFPSGLEESDGIHSVGDGKDYTTDPQGDLSADPLGRPVRLAQAHGLLATSLSSPVLQGWVDHGGDLADDESLPAVAGALDGAHVLSAYLETMDGAVRAVGVGWAADGDAPVVSIAYDLGSEEAAKDAAPGIEQAYARGSSQATRQPYADLLPDAAVAVRGRVVVATVHPAAGRVSVPIQMIAQQDLPGLS